MRDWKRSKMNNSFISVLLIEDNPGDACLISEMLSEKKEGQFSLEWADSMAKGLGRIAVEKFDLILLDLSLQDSHGFETFAQAFAAASDIPIVVMSGYDDEELALRAVREGAQDYLIKGETDASHLTRAIRYAIERREAQAKIKTLQGLLPICASCKKIREDTGYWKKIEQYITEHSGAAFSHGICPDCIEKHYPEFAKEVNR
jgi:CheY-like chemotaxis protein